MVVVVNFDSLNLFPEGHVILHIGEIGALQVIDVKLYTSNVLKARDLTQFKDKAINSVGRVESKNV
jgi:hypothetical protein